MRTRISSAGFGIIAALLAVVFACDGFDYPVNEFHAEQTGTVTLGTVQPAEGEVSVGEGGVVCIAPGTAAITLPLDNGQGYSFREEGLISFPDGLPAGVSVTARQSGDKKAIEITVSGAAEGAEFPLSLSVKTAKEGRLLTERVLQVACVNFETRLSSLSISGVPDAALGFNGEVEIYSRNAIPTLTVDITYAALNPEAEVSVSGTGPNIGNLPVSGNTVTLDLGQNIITVRVTAAHGAAVREYKLLLTRNPAASSNSLGSFAIGNDYVTTSPSSKGVIDEGAGTVSIILPYGTDLRSITPALAHTGASYEPEGAGDFSNPVDYTIKAQDSTAKTYTVTVTTADLFSIAIVNPPNTTTYRVNGTFDPAGMTVQGTDSLGNKVDVTGEFGPASYVYNFSTPGTGTVTLNHSPGISAALPVTVSNNAKRITGFSINGVSAASGSGIDEAGGTITLILPYGTDLTGLTPTVYIAGDDYSPKTAQDFSGSISTPVEYIVTAADDTTRTYAVTVKTAALDTITITTLPAKTVYKIGDTLDTAGIAFTGKDALGNTITVFPVSDSFDYSGFSSAGRGPVTVTAAHQPGGKTAAFQVTVQNNIATLEKFEVSGYTLTPAFNPGITGGTYNYTLTVPHAVTSVSLIAAISANTWGEFSAGSSGYQTIDLASGSGSATVKVKSEDGAHETAYTLTVTRQGQGAVTIEFTGAPADESTTLTGAANTLFWSANTSMSVKTPDGSFTGASFQWYRDGKIWTGETGGSITVSARNFSVAMGHQLTLKITTTTGEVWSKSVLFDVVN
jgi:hypothetical protein